MGLKKRIIVELAPTAIDGAVLRAGRVVRTARVELEPTDWQQAWEEGLSRFDSQLAALIAQLKAPGARVDIAYRSPSSFAEVITVPVTGSAVESAARLALADRVSFDLQMNPHCISPISTAKIDGAKATHTLAVGDVSDVSEKLSAWVERAGCRLVTALPTSAMVLAVAIDEACDDGDESASTRLYVDQHCAILTVVSGGVVRIVRRIEIGFEDFVSAITRTIKRHDAQDAGDEPITLTPKAARALLSKLGIPEFQATVDDALGLKGKDILPLIQPALQRMAIEIKQSLRFEITAKERESIQLRLSGPFGSMPNLASAICDQIEIPYTDADAGTLDRSTVEAPFHGDPDRAKHLAQLTRSSAIVSDQIIAAQRVDSFRVGIRFGGVAAVLAMVAIASVMYSQIRNERFSTQYLGAAKVSVDQIIKVNESITVRSNTLSATQQRMGAAIGMTVHWSDVLTALPGLIPESVTLIEIEGSEQSEQESPKLEFTGTAQNTEELTCQETLSVLIKSLSACPLVESVDLGVTNRVGSNAQAESMRFSIVVNLIATPRLTVASDDGRATP